MMRLLFPLSMKMNRIKKSVDFWYTFGVIIVGGVIGGIMGIVLPGPLHAHPILTGFIMGLVSTSIVSSVIEHIRINRERKAWLAGYGRTR